MTSSDVNFFRVTDPLCGEFTGHRWIPRTKAIDAELWCFLWSEPWRNIREAGDLRRHRAHFDVIVMIWTIVGLLLIVGDVLTGKQTVFTEYEFENFVRIMPGNYYGNIYTGQDGFHFETRPCNNKSVTGLIYEIVMSVEFVYSRTCISRNPLKYIWAKVYNRCTPFTAKCAKWIECW